MYCPAASSITHVLFQMVVMWLRAAANLFESVLKPVDTDEVLQHVQVMSRVRVIKESVGA